MSERSSNQAEYKIRVVHNPEGHRRKLGATFSSAASQSRAEEENRACLTNPPTGMRFSDEYCLQALSDWSLFPKVLNIREASWLTQVPVKTLYKWNSEGKL